MRSPSHGRWFSNSRIQMHERGGAVLRAGLALGGHGTAEQHKIVVGRPSIVRAHELAMDSEEVPLDAAVGSGVEHRLHTDVADKRASALQTHVGYRVDLVKVHHIGERLVLAPEDR